MQNLHEGINFFVSIVECKGRTHRAFEAEMTLRGHRTVVAGAHRDSVMIQVARDVFVRYARNDK